MKLYDYLNNFSKYNLYETYRKIAYGNKEYEKITKKKMINEIILQLQQENFIYYYCTPKELDFLMIKDKNNLSIKQVFKYNWEIETLVEKGIYCTGTSSCFEELEQHVKQALKLYKKNKNIKQHNDKLITLMIGFVKAMGDISTDVLKNIISNLVEINPDNINKLFGNPLFHYYCDFYYKYMEYSKKEEFVYYRKYEDKIDELQNARMQYGCANETKIYIEDYIDIFYHDFPIRKEIVKKMNDAINNNMRNYYLNIIEEARVLNNYYLIEKFINNEELLTLIKEALKEIPCCAMNGATPNEYESNLHNEIELEKRTKGIKQQDAHLSKQDADLFYDLYFSLIEYTNKIGNVVPNLKKIYKQNFLNPKNIYEINEYLFNNIEIIDDYIKENPHKFDQNKLEMIKEFKKGKTGLFILVDYEEEYTRFINEESKTFMVKGIRDNIDNIVNFSLPCGVMTTLLPFKNKIIINGLISDLQIQMGANSRMQMLEDTDKNIKYYHL